ncbi:UNVERIFIED_CONTAM: hypothetical protein K2H54_050207 [Gekko kuhli]
MMSGEEGHEAPVTTAELTLVTVAIVPISTTTLVSMFGGGTIPRHLYPIPYYTPQAPQYFSGIRGMLGTTPLRWSQFNVESMQETYLLTQGPRRDSQFDMGLFPNLGSQVPRQSGAGGVAASRAWITEQLKDRKEYLLPDDKEKEDDVEQCLDALERAQRKFHQDLEIIRAIPDMAVRVRVTSGEGGLAGAEPRSPGTASSKVLEKQKSVGMPPGNQTAPETAVHPSPLHCGDRI